MSDQSGFAGRLPDGMFPSFLQPFYEDGLAIALAGLVAAVVVFLAGYWLAILIGGDWRGFRGFLTFLFRGEEIAGMAPALLFASALAALATARRSLSARSVLLVDVALVGTVVLTAVLLLAELLAVVVDLTYIGDGFAAFLANFAIHFASLVALVVTGVWAMGQLSGRRDMAPPAAPPPPAV